MKKFYLTLCSVVVSSIVCAQTTDTSLFGFKGKVTNASINSGGTSYESYSFGTDGNNSDKIYLWDGTEGRSYDVVITNRARNGFSGDSYYGKFKATVAKSKITKMTISGTKNDNPSTYTCTYTYDKDGNLKKVNETFVYYKVEGIEYGANYTGVDNYNNEVQSASNDYYRDIESQANAISRNPLAAMNAQRNIEQSANRAANRITNAAQGVGVNAYARTRKTKKTVKAEYTYSNYEFDDIGNWTSRTYQNGTDIVTQFQTINYDPVFWSQFYWERLEKEGNLQKIEAFFLNPITTKKYKELASDFWNKRIMDEVAQKYNNNLDTLCILTKKKIVNDSNKEQALEIVREKVFKNDVMTERDYSKVSQMKDLQRQNVIVFNDVYRRKIGEQSEKLRTDSLRFLSNKAQQEFDSANYTQALATSKGILIIDPNNESAANLCQQSSYRIILDKETNNTIDESDYVNFIEEYANSSYVPDIRNRRALFASSRFNKGTSVAELERVNQLPTDEPTHKTVKKRYKKWMFKNNRDRFFHIGLDGEFALGATNTVAGGGLLFRLGHTANLLNFVTGIRYNYLTPTSSMFKTPKEDNKAFFENQYLSVPAILQINIIPGYTGCTYIGIGAEINVNNISTELRTSGDGVKEKDFANTSCVIPRISFGGRLLGMELELFATYDTKNPFNVDYINAYKIDDDPVENKCDPDIFEKQIKKDGFFDKVRGGLALRFWF